MARARVYLDFNEKWLAAQHQRWQLRQAAENQDKVKGTAAAAAIDALEKQMVEMCRRSHATGDGVLCLRFFISRSRQRLEEDKYLAALARGAVAVPKKSGVVYLSDLTPRQAQQDYSKLRLDRHVQDGRMVLEPESLKYYQKGLGTHANSIIVYQLDGKYERFRCHVGLQAVGPMQGGSVVFQVFVDGRKAYDSNTMRQPDEPKTIDISVACAVELKLVVLDVGDGIGRDWANWADAHLVRRSEP